MTDKETDIAGKTLGDVEPDLLAEFVQHLRSRNISPAAYVPNDDEIPQLCERLAQAPLLERCECGQIDCRTYRFNVPEKTHAVSHYTVRFYARGEAMLHIDSDPDIYKLERLTDLSLGGPLTVYAKRAYGSWSEQRLGVIRE